MDDGSNHAPGVRQSQEPLDDLMNAPETDALVLSDTEKLVLQLYDQVRELELEHSLLEAQQNDAPSDDNLSDDEVSKQLLIAEHEAMEARASYLLRNKIIDQVLITDPVLKAVHAGTNASFDERRLTPPLHTRDLLSLHLSDLTHRLTTATTTLTLTAKSLAAANRQNAALAASLLALASPRRDASDTITNDALLAANPKLQDQLLEAERDAAAARRRWRCVKGVVAGVVVGSGVEWAGEEGLRGLVLEDEDELVEEQEEN